MSEVVERTEHYYDSKDADAFYYRIWGGEDIHIGTYEREGESIFEASRRTVERMADKISHFQAGSTVLDIGSGYGGAARYLAQEKGYRVHCLNLSKVQNERNRQMNEEQTLSVLVDVVDGNFESLPFDEGSIDVVWSQDAILHSGDRKQVFAEVDRVLKPGGQFIFTDPMMREGVDPEALQPVLDRIHLSDLGSVETYTDYANQLGWKLLEYDGCTNQLINHYSAVLDNLQTRSDELEKDISPDYIENMKRGLAHWINAGKAGHLAWGTLHFEKPGE